ncbi:uncharacterized protein [Anabrus simplex]|uniref:uncharacterized protein n=1 Tax=Anabrus simplex TaxID=316456 RepID=UPI0034DD95D9
MQTSRPHQDTSVCSAPPYGSHLDGYLGKDLLQERIPTRWRLLIFDSFNVGRYEPAALDGCPDGFMQLSELGRPFTGGSWCGSSSGYAVYYSETSTVTASIKLFPSPLHADTPFEFQLRYKFVGRDEAVVRFGSAGAPLERGEVVPGTYCSRNFYECYRKRCRLQSPNYPGMYPRNVTCYLTLRQKTVPNCKHAMISVRQDSEHKVQIKRAVNLASFNKTGRILRAWRDCTGERDHLIFYDGASTDDPVLVKFCGGDWLPRVVSRGPEMLVAFHSSPFSIPLHSDTSPSPLRGFELDVDIIFADSDSFDYSRDKRRCEFWVNATSPDGEEVWGRSSRGRSGHVLSPRHTLAPNSTCVYRFRGHARDKVWVFFVAYSQQALLPNTSAVTSGCATRLRIWDGGGIETDTKLIADHCDFDPPRLCDHTSLGNATRATRPCSPEESYVSSGSFLTVAHTTAEGTALHPTTFRLHYEFVDTRMGGEPWAGRKGDDTPPPQPCSRIFRHMKSGEIWSPRNVFLYGRGGAHNLSCVFRVEAAAGEKVRLTLHNASFGESPACSTEPDPHTGRPRCMRNSDVLDARIAELKLLEVPWRDVRVPRVCLCDNSTLSTTGARHIVFMSSSRVLELHFTVSRLNITEDFTDLYFFASFEMIRSPECPRRQRLRGSGGEVQFASPPQSRPDAFCEGLPWLVEAHDNRSLFLLTWGTFLPVHPTQDEPARCHTRNRILLYSGRPARLMRVVCPASPNARQYAVHVFSEEWFGDSGSSPGFYLQPPRPPSFLVEFVGRETGIAAFNWLEISRSRSSLLQQLQLEDGVGIGSNDSNGGTLLSDWDCPHRCPELNACISSSLWCDGHPHCPSGYDEDESHCGAGRRLLSFLPGGVYTLFGGGAAAIAAVIIFICVAIAHRVRTRRRRRRLGKKKRGAGEPRRVPTMEMLLDPTGSTTSS